MSEIIISSNLNKNQYLETSVKTMGKLPNYIRLGKGGMNKHNIESIDMVNEIMLMTKAEHLVIKTIKSAIDKQWDSTTWEMYLPLAKLLSKSKYGVFFKGFKLLKDKNLVVRTKQGHYLINPRAFIPPDYQAAMKLWLLAGGSNVVHKSRN